MADEALWAFGVVAHDAGIPRLSSEIAGPRPVEEIAHDDLVLLATRVPRAEFDEEALRRNFNDLAWLERVARAHEAVLDEALRHATIVPLRLATIFDDEASAARMLERHAEALRGALAALDGRQEWSVKLLVPPGALGAAPAASEEPGAARAGTAYMLRRRAEREQREESLRLAASMADDVHARIAERAVAAVLRPAQNPELSGHEGDMLLNGAYLVDAADVPRLHELVAELGECHAESRARIELTGPFPPYNFVPEL